MQFHTSVAVLFANINILAVYRCSKTFCLVVTPDGLYSATLVKIPRQHQQHQTEEIEREIITLSLKNGLHTRGKNQGSRYGRVDTSP